MYGSACFGRPHAHHQELNNCSSSLWFYRWSVVVAVLLVVVGPTGVETPDCRLKVLQVRASSYNSNQSTNQLDATVSQFYYWTFMYCSTCFRRPHVHHQELNNCSSNLWFYRWSVVVTVLLVVVGPVVSTRPTTTNSTSITTLRR